MADEQVIARAKELGWRPLPADPENPTQDEFKGDPSKFVEPEEFIERGERVLPIVREHNKKLEQELRQSQARLRELEEMQQASAEAIEALKENHKKDVQRQVELTRERILNEIKKAREDGNIDKEFELREDLDALRETKPDADKPDQQRKSQQQPTMSAEAKKIFLDWQADNEWYGADLRKTALADGIATELRKDPANKGLTGRAFYDRVTQEVNEYLAPTRRNNRVESGGAHRFAGEEDGGSGGGNGKTYNDLPADAKAQCQADMKQLVGKGRAFATEAEYKKHYAEQYYRYV